MTKFDYFSANHFSRELDLMPDFSIVCIDVVEYTLFGGRANLGAFRAQRSKYFTYLSLDRGTLPNLPNHAG